MESKKWLTVGAYLLIDYLAEKNNISTGELKDIAYRIVGRYMEREPEFLHEDIYRHFCDKLVSLFDFIPDSSE
ncbi:MAG: hypothetical protein QXM92_01620 [Candidatus Anstonellales archaeon]